MGMLRNIRLSLATLSLVAALLAVGGVRVAMGDDSVWGQMGGDFSPIEPSPGVTNGTCACPMTLPSGQNSVPTNVAALICAVPIGGGQLCCKGNRPQGVAETIEYYEIVKTEECNGTANTSCGTCKRSKTKKFFTWKASTKECADENDIGTGYPGGATSAPSGCGCFKVKSDKAFTEKPECTLIPKKAA